MSPPDPLAPLIAYVIHAYLGILLPLALVLALCAAGLAWLKPHMVGAAGERMVARRLRRLGFPALHDVIVAAPDGSLTQIDHVALPAQGPIAIETKTYAGLILGAAGDRFWPQVLGRTRSRFQNPLRQNHKHILALCHHLNQTVGGLVVFAGAARFPAGLPEGVTTLSGLDGALSALGRPPPGRTEAADWQIAARLAEAGRGLHGAHLAGLRARHRGA